MSRQVTYETRGTDLGNRHQEIEKEHRKKNQEEEKTGTQKLKEKTGTQKHEEEKPALAGKHGCEGEEDGHGDGQPLSNALGRQEEGQPGDSKVDRGGEVGLDQVVPSTEQLLSRINICQHAGENYLFLSPSRIFQL